MMQWKPVKRFEHIRHYGLVKFVSIFAPAQFVAAAAIYLLVVFLFSFDLSFQYNLAILIGLAVFSVSWAIGMFKGMDRTG